MRNKLLLLFAPILLVAAYAADTAPVPAKLEFPKAGFRISALDVPPKDQDAPLEMSLLPENMSLLSGKPGITASASVGISIQPDVKSLADCIAKEKKDLAAKHVAVLSEKTPSANEWVVEYSGGRINFQQLHLHLYRRVFFANGKVYRVQAISQDADWPAVGALLKACVDSFELAPAPAPTSAIPNTATSTKLNFPNCGFRISALEPPSTPTPGYNPPQLSMQFQVNRIFASVNVSIMSYAKTMADFIADRKKQGAHADAKSVADSGNLPAANTFTYVDGLGYNRAILANGKLYLAYAFLGNVKKPTAQTADFNAKLKACVDSLELIPSPSPAVPSP